MRRLVLGTLVMWLFPAVGAAGPPMATVGDRAISREEVESSVRAKLFEIETARYEALRQGVDALVADALLEQEAKARGITRAAVEQQEIAAKAKQPTAEEVQELYDNNKAQLDDAPLESVKPRLVAYLVRRNAMQRRTAFLEQLKGKHRVAINLRPPVVEVGIGSKASRGGGTDAPITMIEFSDYECAFCRRAEPTVERVLSSYGDKIRFAYRDYPLPFHANARPAAEAAHCANARGKFWPYHSKLMASDSLDGATLRALAGEVGLDAERFERCLTSGEFSAAVDRDIADAEAAGVNGTPAFFINGRMLDGAQPFEKLKQVIDEELARAQQG